MPQPRTRRVATALTSSESDAATSPGTPGVLSVGGFNFQKNASLLNGAGSLGVTLSSGITPDVAIALAAPTEPFPERDIDVASVALSASTPKPIEFARGTDKISFTASASAFAGLGVYHSGAALLKQLGANPVAGQPSDDLSLTPLEFGVDDDTLLSVIRWGFDASGKVSGAMALGAVGTATLAVSGNTEGLFAVVRRLNARRPARDIVQTTLDSWMLPRQMRVADQLEPGTWILAEVVGGIKLTAGAQLGFSYNWVREATLGGLTGDIGLRLQMGINAAIGFSAAGRCFVIVSRESEAPALRVRLFRMASRQFDLSLDAALAVQATDTLLPTTVDDFIAAVFDTHGQQIIRDLKILDTWTDPDKKLTELLASAGIDGAEQLIARVAGVTKDQLQNSFDQVHATVVSFIDKWHDLPHRVSSLLLKVADDKVNLSEVRAIATTLSTIGADGLKTLLERQLGRADFFLTPGGQLLESFVEPDGVLTLLNRPVSEVHDLAGKILAILDGSVVEDALQRFQAYLEEELNLTKALEVATETDFAALDALLKKKLATFLGQQTLVFADIDKIRKTVNILLGKRKEFYDKAVAALHKQYNVSFAAAYHSSTTRQALLDATFDFSRDTANVSRLFQDAVSGNLDALLTTPHPQVSLATATLTHAVKRQATIDVTLPFVGALESQHLNESVAAVKATPADGGLLVTLNSTDTIATNQRRSVLSVALNLALTAGENVRIRVHDPSIVTSYSLLFARRNLKVDTIRAFIAPVVATYFGGSDGKIPDLDGFMAFVDRRAEEEIANGPNLLGNGLVSVQVTLSDRAAQRAGRAWLSLPSDPRAEIYQKMSIGIQNSLKAHIHDAVFTEPDGYANTNAALIVLAYCALARRAERARNDRDLPFWDWVDSNERSGMLAHPTTITSLQRLLTRAQEVLRDDDHQAQFFKPADARAILSRIDPRTPQFESFLFAEAEVIKHAFQAGLKIGAFQERLATQPKDAIAALAQFGSKLTEAFNANLTSLLGPGIRSLGTLVFYETAEAIDPLNADRLQPANALLSLEFMKPDAPFDTSALLAAGRVDPQALAFADRVVQIN